ncbi:MAG TPA: hypothetical protein VGP56_05740 [Gaiellaceae bacterium]|nr:hypothetical protein [Gaiellaceae bacterium]
MFPWLIFAVVAVPLLLVGFMATRRKTDAGERPASGETLTDKELAEAEAYEEEWHEQDKEHYREERLP